MTDDIEELELPKGSQVDVTSLANVPAKPTSFWDHLSTNSALWASLAGLEAILAILLSQPALWFCFGGSVVALVIDLMAASHRYGVAKRRYEIERQAQKIIDDSNARWPGGTEEYLAKIEADQSHVKDHLS